MLINCPECQHNVSDRAISCPNCGCPINSQSNANNPSTRGRRASKRFAKLPNGYGTIKKLSGNRRKPYAVYPSVAEKGYKDNGVPVNRKAIGYFENYNDAYQCLVEYNKNPYDTDSAKVTFAELYNLAYTEKYINTKRNYSQSMLKSTQSAFNNLKELHDIPISQIKPQQMQDIVNKSNLKESSIKNMILVLHLTFEYAVKNDYISKNYAKFVSDISSEKNEKGVPFTQDELGIIWQHSDDKIAQIILILIYTGMRISELKTAELHLEERYFKGGIKTKSGKDRIIPIHNSILNFVKDFDAKKYDVARFRIEFKEYVTNIGILMSDKNTIHTPHDCRHTFSWLADRYGMDSLSKHKIMGHSVGSSDVELSVYGHRTIEELISEVDKIEVPFCY